MARDTSHDGEYRPDVRRFGIGACAGLEGNTVTARPMSIRTRAPVALRFDELLGNSAVLAHRILASRYRYSLIHVNATGGLRSLAPARATTMGLRQV
jgi:hypothetical protein